MLTNEITSSTLEEDRYNLLYTQFSEITKDIEKLIASHGFSDEYLKGFDGFIGYYNLVANIKMGYIRFNIYAFKQLESYLSLLPISTKFGQRIIYEINDKLKVTVNEYCFINGEKLGPNAIQQKVFFTLANRENSMQDK